MKTEDEAVNPPQPRFRLRRALLPPVLSVRLERNRTITIIAYVVAATIVGIISVYIERLLSWTFTWTQHWFSSFPLLSLVICPAAFLLASLLVRKFAPWAGGSGIPQVLKATELSIQGAPSHVFTPLSSIRGSIFKVLSVVIGLLGGASIGREGPTVQISASIFQATARLLSRFGARVTFHPFLVGGASCGIAAAFNTPLAGITFALEEIAGSIFTSVRQVVLLAIIVAGLVARTLAGNYLYFGHPTLRLSNDFALSLQAFGIGLGGGLMASLFCVFVLSLKRRIDSSSPLLRTYLFPLACGFVIAVVALFTEGKTLGAGYEPARQLLESTNAPHSAHALILFPILKLGTTVFSFVSGMGGGIFAPCLSIGAGLGGALAEIFAQGNSVAFALLGMAAFLAGVTQAPLTSFIIVMEMTDEHTFILPLMVASFAAFGASRALGLKPIYHALAGLIVIPSKEGPMDTTGSLQEAAHVGPAATEGVAPENPQPR